jgi:NifU-like protein involved in Fe-S cluster formation
VLEDAVAFAGVSKYPARIKCALLGWMAWKAATTVALEKTDRAASDLTSTGNNSPTRGQA